MPTVLVPEHLAGQRLDHFLVAELGMSRSQIRRRIEAGDVLVNGSPPNKAGQALNPGEVVAVEIPPPPPVDAIPEDIPLDVVYEDRHMLVVNKDADMVVHPAPGHETGTLVNALVHHYDRLAPDPRTEDGRPRPGIVHRLDRGTSGLILVARDLRARDALSSMIMAREVSRRYLAVVHGPNLADSGTWDTLHGRHPTDRKRFSSRVRSGKTAVTHWKVLARGNALALIECRLETGRTHQIRVHCADHGHPVVGDPAYAGRRKGHGSLAASIRRLDRQMLHAWQLKLEHPISAAPLHFLAAPPYDMLQIIRGAFGNDILKLVCRGPEGITLTPHTESLDEPETELEEYRL